MHGMRGLTIVVAQAAPERFRTALSICAANAALGGRSRIFLESAAVALLRTPIHAPDDEAHAAAGLPRLATLLDEAIGLGVEVIACQTGLQLTGADARDLHPAAAFGGLVSLLQGLGEDRLTIA
ncbi:MAG: peroxiredoxin [Sphingomonas bacterium]|nr:peroxiredoxin [Sphingomonas bacterium]